MTEDRLADQHRASSARLYWENELPFFATEGVTVPLGVSTFADETFRPLR